MNKQSVIISIIIFTLIVVGMFTYTYIKKQELTVENNNPDVVQDDEESIASRYGIESIDAKQYYIDGLHTLVGEIVMPTPCDLIDVEAQVAESYPEQVTLDFTVINTAEACAQSLTTQRFLVEFQASEEAKISARFMGEDIRLNIIPAGPGEVPEDFELYIKG